LVAISLAAVAVLVAILMMESHQLLVFK